MAHTYATVTNITRTNIEEKLSFQFEPREDASRLQFWHLTGHIFEHRVGQVFRDGFRPSRVTENYLRFHGDQDIANDHLHDRAGSLFSRSAEYTGREVLVASDLFEWARREYGWTGSILENSIGGVNEEQIRVLDLAPSQAEHDWLRTVSANHELKYGLRPFNRSPYIFLGSKVSYHHQTLLTADLRYRPLSSQKIEGLLSIPIVDGWTLSSGFSYKFNEPLGIASVVRLNWRLKDQAEFSIGVVIGEHPRPLISASWFW